MGRVDGKVAFITGAGRGQGRSHALRLAEEGADIVGIDACVDFETAPYPMATREDLAETERLVKECGGRVLVRQADVRYQSEIDAAVTDAVSAFGHIDVVCANAGIVAFAKTWEYTEQSWDDQIAVLLTGTWHTLKATVPSMIDAGNGGSIIITSSLAGLKGFANDGPYTAAKHGVVGMARALAQEVGEHRIRVNTIHPTNVDTMMIQNEAVRRLFRPDLDRPPTVEEFMGPATAQNLIPVPWIEPIDVSNAVLWLASDESRYVTGVALPIDAGASQR